MDSFPTVNRRPGRWWKFLQFSLTRFALVLVAIGLWVALVRIGAKHAGLKTQSPPGALVGLVIAQGVLVIYAVCVRALEQRQVVELAGKGSLRLLGVGTSMGGLLFGATMLVLWLLGAWSLTGLAVWSAFFYPLIGALVSAVLEETVFRGLLFRLLEEGLGSCAALVMSALVFGLLHVINPGATLFSGLAVALEAGVLLSAAYMFARRLWLPIGIHLGWNFSEGGIFSTSVSGGRAAGLIGGRFKGSDLLTGGAFGPEASLVAVLVCLAASVVVIVLARRAGQVMPPPWRRGSGKVAGESGSSTT
jgi:membrane protease YdiL (CAAX protease family)